MFWDQEPQEENESIMLEEDIDEDYEPDNEGKILFIIEILEYAHYLGMDLN